MLEEVLGLAAGNNNNTFPFTIDSGWTFPSSISKNTATLIQIEQYPKRFIYHFMDNEFQAVYRLPSTPGELKINMEVAVSPRDVGIDYDNVIAVDELTCPTGISYSILM
jgi:hypothetical protein